MTPGELLRLRRNDRQMTQRALGDAVGVTPQAVSEWETGKSIPDRMNAQAIDAALEASGVLVGAFGYLVGELRGNLSTPGAEVTQPWAEIPGPTAEELRQLIAAQALQLEQLTARVEDLDAELRLLRLAVGRAAPGSA